MKTKRILSIMLTLTMVLSLVSAMGITASAASKGDTCPGCGNGTLVWVNNEGNHNLRCTNYGNGCDYIVPSSDHNINNGETNNNCSICHPPLADGTGDFNLTLSSSIVVGDTPETIAAKIGGYDTGKLSIFDIGIFSTDYETKYESIESASEEYAITIRFIMNDLSDSFDSTIYDCLGDGSYMGLYNYAVTLGEVVPDEIGTFQYDVATNLAAFGNSSDMICNILSLTFVTDISKFKVYTPIPAFADITSDSGYYAPTKNASDDDKSGIIAFTSIFNNLATEFKDYTFDAENDKFGIAMFTTATEPDDDYDKTTLDTKISSTDFTELKNADGYFYSFVNEIGTANFNTPVYAIPFAIIGGTTYWGNFTSATVNSEKWLGNISNSPVKSN